MRRNILPLAIALAMGIGQAQAANDFVFLWQDTTDNLFGITWENGVIIQNVNVGHESYNGSYGLGWDPNSFLTSDVNINVNIVEPGTGALSDTFRLFGRQGDGSLNIPFISDATTPLSGAVTLGETGGRQTVFQNTLTNGDTYTWQFQSGVPEPSTWALMLVGFAGLGFASYRASRKNVAVAVSV